MKTTLALMVSFAAALAPACTDPGSQEADDLAAARDRFSQASPTSYSFTWKLGCFCGPDATRPIRISVTGGQITSAMYTDDQTAADPTKLGLRTIDGVFNLIQSSLDHGADTVQVIYDPSVGYPTSLYLDPVKNAYDDESSLDLSDFGTPADVH